MRPADADSARVGTRAALRGATVQTAACQPRYQSSVAEFIMWNDLYLEIRHHGLVYRNFFLDEWRDLNPVSYSVVLVSVMVFGWVLMRSKSRR